MHAGSRPGALVALLFCFSCPARGTREGIDVAVGETSVTLTCPEDDQVLKRSEVEVSQETPWTAKEEGELEQMERGVVYVCNSVKATHKIYLKVKVCEGCVDLGLGLVAGVIVSDLLVTLGVLILVYFCSRSRTTIFKREAKKGQPKGQKVDSPPPVPNPDYEPIRKGQREVYAGLAPRIF
uniref:T-cell surface glycoprotein CD3 epsilon chain isoform X1 n=1 Tax=Pogona vitticeps TaxID=103695 RepID=A0A6J0TML8_9SAUR